MRPVLLAALAVALAGCDRTPDADALLDRMQDRYDADMEGVRDLAVTGEGVTAYFRRTGTDSLATFELRALPADSTAEPSEEAFLVLEYLPNVPAWVRGLRGRAEVVGTRTVGGARTYVLSTDDVVGFIGLTEGAPDEELADVAQVFVEAETGRVRGLRFESGADSTRERPVVQETFYDDYRDVQGHPLPFTIRRRNEGMDQLMPDEYRVVMKGNLGIERGMAERLPPGRREAALAEIDRQIRELETGETARAFQVDSVRVNGEVPAGLFDPAPPSAASGTPPQEP